MEMRRTEHEAAVSRSDDFKTVADTPDESYVVFRTSTGVRISSQLNDDDGIICSDESKSDLSDAMPVKDEVTGDGSVTLCDDVESESYRAASLEFRVKEEPDLDFENQGEEMVIDIVEKPVVVALAQEEAQSVVEAVSRGSGNECVTVEFKQEPENLETDQSIIPAALILAPKPLQVIRPKAEMLDTPEVIDVESDFLNRIVKQERSGTHVKMEPPVEETKVGALSLSLQVREEKPVYAKKVNARKVKVEDGDFPVEKDWYLVGRSLVTATSTSKGRRLEDNEVVNFAFPSTVNLKVPNIVRFSTKRCGEAIPSLQRYLLILAEFTPQELDSRKRSLNLENDSDERAALLAIAKRRNGAPLCLEHNKDEEDAPESYVNRVVGAADSYNLEEMEAPSTLTCDLRPYQKQALYWMSESEKGIDVDKAAETLHPCWEAYRICDERAPSIYVNIFSGEATIQFPTATQMARGGILADAMGLGKTVMTIALILARPGRGNPEIEDDLAADVNGDTPKRKKSHKALTCVKAKGGTLIVCPMALLSQWKDELETHSMPDTVSVLSYYGGDRTQDAKAIASHDVVLTTYGVLTSAYKQDMANSIFHRIDWYRIVLDEAHTIKSWKTQAAKATFELSSHCRWCLTGTPLQNKLEDLYSLLCFLHVEPWCNWAWWNKLIQKPYENGDPRGLKLIKAILRPLMLRRTKETRDKEGSLILELPPTDVKVIECEQSEGERDFYTALFKRSKVQFDQFVAHGRVLHNYANILELLLRLRQCCNHPFLVMSRADSQQYADLDSLARRFLDNNPDSVSQKAPSRAYIEEVIQDIRDGNSKECPICLESADDPILTPCAHRMCRECLLTSWRSASCGLCPICRTVLKKTELISCPTESIFRVDVVKNWKESSKVSELIECLEKIRMSGTGEKSIVFSQWTSFLDLLEIPLRRRGIEFLRFDGKLAQKAREKVLKEFNETNQKTVLLMSLKAGGVGLNLTAASNVFLMVLCLFKLAFFMSRNPSLNLHGLSLDDCAHMQHTVEERMQQVQARKQRMIAGALTDEEVRSARLEELKMLFR
ncbi:hypothetical protein DY000_02024287 [Brassica cretica]|uniref:RING-type domain-containing protein n=1 Tax=Brassica cretica TaxID=69181 RepID=A0ABQ7E1B9_BRACR|nr:hypothetical protein DY000_02024287 [Brassica cretica]